MDRRIGLAVGGVMPREYVPDQPDAYAYFNFTEQRYRLNGRSAKSFTSAKIAGLTVSRTHTNTTYATVEDDQASLSLVAANVARIGRNKGLLVEESRVERWGVAYDALASAIWPTLSNATVGSGTLPSRLSGACVTRITTTASNGRIQRNITVSADTNPHVFVVDLEKKAVTYRVEAGIVGGTTVSQTLVFNGLTGAITSGTGVVTSKNAAWWRVSVVVTNNGTAGNTLLYNYVQLDGAAGQTADVSLPNCQDGAFATSFILPASGGASATRAADSISISGVSWPTEGALYGTALGPPGGGLSQRLVGANGGIAPLYLNGTVVGTYNGTTALTRAVAVTLNQRIKAGVSWTASGRSVTADGQTPASDANGIGAVNTLYLGSAAGSTNFLNNYIERVLLYPANDAAAVMQSRTQ